MELSGMVEISLNEHGIWLLTKVPAVPISGGMVAESARVETREGPVFVKWKADAPDRFFECEANGLQRIANTRTLRVPEVLVAYDASPRDVEIGWQSVLALEWIEERKPIDTAAFSSRFAQGLAKLHSDNLSSNGM